MDVVFEVYECFCELCVCGRKMDVWMAYEAQCVMVYEAFNHKLSIMLNTHNSCLNQKIK